MSVEAFSWALSVPIGGNAKVILLGLANHAHPDGTEAYPALDTLAKYAHCDRSTARRNVRKLITEGWIFEDGHGPRGQIKYRLPVTDPRGTRMPPPPLKREVAPGQPGGGTSALEGVAPMQPEPSIEPFDVEPVIEARERAQTPTGYSFNGHRVKAEDGQKACGVLATFNELAGAALKPFLASGASPELKRVTRAVLDHPDLSADEWRAVIRWTLEHPWWSGTVTIGAVFGPNAVGENIDKWRRRAENGARPLAIVPSPQQPVRHDRYSEKREREIAREEAAQRVLAARQREDQ